MSYLATITQDIIQTGIKEFKKGSNRQKINKYVIDPVINELYGRCVVPLTIFSVTQIIILILLIYITLKIRHREI